MYNRFSGLLSENDNENIFKEQSETSTPEIMNHVMKHDTPLSPASIIMMQRTLGNRYVSRLIATNEIQRQSRGRNAAPNRAQRVIRASERLQHELGRILTHMNLSERAMQVAVIDSRSPAGIQELARLVEYYISRLGVIIAIQNAMTAGGAASADMEPGQLNREILDANSRFAVNLGRGVVNTAYVNWLTHHQNLFTAARDRFVEAIQ